MQQLDLIETKNEERGTRNMESNLRRFEARNNLTQRQSVSLDGDQITVTWKNGHYEFANKQTLAAIVAAY